MYKHRFSMKNLQRLIYDEHQIMKTHTHTHTHTHTYIYIYIYIYICMSVRVKIVRKYLLKLLKIMAKQSSRTLVSHQMVKKCKLCQIKRLVNTKKKVYKNVQKVVKHGFSSTLLSPKKIPIVKTLLLSRRRKSVKEVMLTIFLDRKIPITIDFHEKLE